MTGIELVRVSLRGFKENELIIANRFYHEKMATHISEAAFYKALERMCKSGELVRITKGTYHLPKKGRYGIVPPSEREIVAAFTARNLYKQYTHTKETP